MEHDILSFVKSGLLATRESPGWIHVAAATGLNYSTLWRIAYGRSNPNVTSLQPLSDWLRENAAVKPAQSGKRASNRMTV